MEMKRHKADSLNRYFGKFLISAIVALVLSGILWTIIWAAVIRAGVVIPANMVEKSVLTWQQDLKKNAVVKPEDIPEYAKYAIFEKKKSTVQSNMSESELNLAKEFMNVNDTKWISGISSKVYIKEETDTQWIVVLYRIHASFKSPLSGKPQIDAEIAMLAALFVFIVVGQIMVSLRFAGKLGKNVTKMKRAAEQISLHNLDFAVEDTGIKEFDQVMDSLSELRDSLKESLVEQWYLEQGKKRQMSALAHDIKTPLTILKGNTELLAESELTDEQAEYLDYIQKNEEQIADYVIKILEISRTEKENSIAQSGEMEREGTKEFQTSRHVVAKIDEIVDALKPDFNRLCEKKKIKVIYDIEDGAKETKVKSEVCRRIVMNLFDNAVQFSPENGNIYVCIRKESYRIKKLGRMKEKNGVIIEITDEGPGFSPKALKCAVEEFYRADESRGSKEHFGLGLSIVKQLVEEEQGKLHIQNREDCGAKIAVWLPEYSEKGSE